MLKTLILLLNSAGITSMTDSQGEMPSSYQDIGELVNNQQQKIIKEKKSCCLIRCFTCICCCRKKSRVEKKILNEQNPPLNSPLELQNIKKNSSPADAEYTATAMIFPKNFQEIHYTDDDLKEFYETGDSSSSNASYERQQYINGDGEQEQQETEFHISSPLEVDEMDQRIFHISQYLENLKNLKELKQLKIKEQQNLIENNDNDKQMTNNGVKKNSKKLFTKNQ